MLHTASLPIISIPDINDAGRGRFSFQERLPGLRSTPLTIGESEVQIYTHGEDLYYDERLAQHMEDIFFEGAANARELTLREWRRRSPVEKFAETMLLPLRPLL